MWLRPKKPSGLRSQRCVRSTAYKCGIRPSTKLGLRPFLLLGEQRMCTNPKPYIAQAPQAPRSPRGQMKARKAQLKLFL